MMTGIYYSKSFKVLSWLLVITVLMCSIFPQTANASTIETCVGDIYAEGYTETLCIEDKEYTLEYGYNEAGERTINIVNLKNNNVDVLTFNEAKSTVYLNDEVLAHINVQDISRASNNDVAMPNAGWTLIGTDKVTIEWDMAAEAVVIGAAIAGALGLIALVSPAAVTAGAVLASIGPAIVAGWVGISVGGTASLAFYQMVQFGTVQYQMEWSMKVNGKTYECTPIGWVANPYYSISDRVVA